MSNMRGECKWSLDTPCLTLDHDKLIHHLKAMQEHARRFNKNLRPHCKTHKSSSICKMQMEFGAIGVCAVKLSEAEALVRQGILDILITSPIVTLKKMERLANCVQSAPNLMIVVDSQEIIENLQSVMHKNNLRLKVLIDIDGGQGRTGISKDFAVSLAKYIGSQKNLELFGVQCYLGHLQHVSSFQERKEKYLEAMDNGVQAFRQLKALGFSCEILTGGGTGTYEIDACIPEITDIQVGSYVCMDMEYLTIGSSADLKEFSPIFKEPPLTLLATVINNSNPFTVTIDAGLKAIYKDGPGPKVIVPAMDCIYQWSGDEHGKLLISNPSQKPRVGTVCELIVSHCDPTVNLFDRFYVVKDNIVIDIWPIDLRGCVE